MHILTEPGKAVVAQARLWIGTPYHHQMAVRGVGCDCLGLIRGVYAELYGRPTESPPPYTRDWAEATGVETLIEAARRHLEPIPPPARPMPWSQQCREGDVLIFRMRRGALAKHAAIFVTPDTMIHAFENNPVCEVPLSAWWYKRIAATFRFPAVVEASMAWQP